MSSLYLAHFGLQRPPFQITPDIDCFFSGGRRGEMLNALLYVATHDEGITTLVAEVGSGKTLLARLMISRLGLQVYAVYLANPCFGRDEIVVAIARDLGLDVLSGTLEAKLAALQHELLRRYASGQRVVLVIDEAHTMPVESLEEVRLLSNLETSRHKLVNIMLFGQPELDQRLADARLRQVRDRVIHRFDLPALVTQEIGSYIEYRLRVVGWHGGQPISVTALTRLAQASNGRLRRINLLADKALLAVYAQGGRQIEDAHVELAVLELVGVPSPPVAAVSLDKWRVARWSLTISVFMTATLMGLLGWFRQAPLVVSSDNQGVALPVTAAPLAAMPLAQTMLNAALARTETLLQQTPVAGYTIQLAALPSSSNPERYLSLAVTQVNASRLYARPSVYKGEPFTAVYFGTFDSAQAGLLAMEELPASLKVNRPLIRTWAKIKQEQRP